MATLEILLKARDEMTPHLKSAQSSIQSLVNTAKSAGSSMSVSFGKFAENIDRAGVAARTGFSSVSQLAGGASTELGRLTGEAAQTADAIGDLAGAFKNLGGAGLLLGGISLIFAEWQNVAQQTERRLDAVAAPFDKIEERLRQIDSIDPLENLAASIGKSATEFEALVQSSSSAREEVLRWIAAEKELLQLREKSKIVSESQANTFGLLNRAASEGLRMEDIKTFYDGLFTALQNGVGVTANFSGVLGDLDAKQRAAAEGAGVHANALLGLMTAAGSAGAALKTLEGTAAGLVGVGDNVATAWAHAAAAMSLAAIAAAEVDGNASRAGRHLTDNARSIEAVKVQAEQWNAGQKRLDETLKNSVGVGAAYAAMVSQVASKLKGLVSSVLTATTVDDRLKMAGDAWDEFRLRLEAVATGTDPAIYGDKFVQMFNDLHMSAADAAAAFKDMSLFADPKNLNSGIINWEAFTAQIKTNIQSMIGEANLMKEAFRQAVASLSPSEMRAFTQAMDLDPSAAGNVDKLFEAYTSKEAGEATSTLGDMASKIQIIEGTKTTTLNFVWDKAKEAIDAAHDYLEEKILQYGDVLIEITAKFNPPPPPSASGADGGGKAVGGAVFADTSYVVGEHGPEIFVPRTSGTIVPNSRVQNFGGITVSGNTFVIQNDFDMRRFAQVLNQNWGRRIAMRSAMRI